MATSLQTCIREEQRSLIHFLSSEGVKPTEIHKKMKMQYRDTCLSLQQVYEWDKKFKNGMSSVADADGPDRPHTACTPETVEHFEQVI
jgi:hypothetical protein